MKYDINDKLNQLKILIEKEKYEKEILESECDRLMKELHKIETIKNVLFQIAVIILSIFIGIVLCCFVK